MKHSISPVPPTPASNSLAPAPLLAIALRLYPQQDLRLELDALVQRQNLTAACILTCVGSLSEVHLRFANQTSGTVLPGPFEILSLTGVMSTAGSHYHLAIASANGQALGGHLLPGCKIYTTAELVIGLLPTLHFDRQPCPHSGYSELHIHPISTPISSP